MTDIAKEILDTYQIRKTGKQKAAFPTTAEVNTTVYTKGIFYSSD